ncbi:MAG: ATP-binding cassette domain-containing protein [Ruminococcus sp.]
MLQIKNISKKYVTGTLVQQALNDVSLTLRDNEFVAVLGPSGSGKTTLLNVIGGLDRYDSGDLIINGISTKKYKDRDWDSYRNHTIGFVFQSYNLIPHQSVLSNVELALTISGISKSERKKRATEALTKVGLGDQLHKKPNQMSGGQMQRVAIARALVNDPDILLADEPTGALDTETSIQVMDLLKEVAKDRLVVMVTHNPELANQYANRIVRLRDGKIIDDTNPYTVDEEKLEKPKHKNMGKSSMSFFTSIALSFNNLRTKKGRTLLTSFAGSIGIIGIALILALSNGVNTYIEDVQKDTMTSYPITVNAQSMDLTSVMNDGQQKARDKADVDHKRDKVYTNGADLEMTSSVTNSITKNNLTKFKKYIDDKDSEINQYIGENGVVYSYDTSFGVYSYDPEGELVNSDGSTLATEKNKSSSMYGISQMSNMSSMSSMGDASDMSSLMGKQNNNFEEIMPGSNGELVSPAIKENYDLVYGSYPEKYNEVVLVLDTNNEIHSTVLYKLGLLPTEEYRDYMDRIESGKKVKFKDAEWSYEDACKQSFYLVPACDYYQKSKSGTFDDISEDESKVKKLVNEGLELKISGIIRLKDEDNKLINNSVGYTQALTNYIIDYTDKSEVVKAQKKSKNINVINNLKFEPSSDKEKISDAKKYIKNMGVSEQAKMCKDIMTQVYAGNQEMLSQLSSLSESQLAESFVGYISGEPEDEVVLSIYDKYISSGSYDDNMKEFGVVDLGTPSAINIYVDSFEAKDGIAEAVENYNDKVKDADKISYTDYIALLMSSVTTIVNVISYVLIAFVAVSLIVSSIMIGIITYISVLERTKEIGILRAIGASKRNISSVFNAETGIIGLCSGLLGVGISLLLLIPANAIIHSLMGTTEVTASIPVVSGVILVVLSMVLTLIGGLIPAKKAAKKDPVTALRSE